MKALKIIGVILLILLALFLIIPLFLASEVSVSEKVNIKAKPVTVFNQVRTLTNWNNWSPFHAADTAMELSYAGEETGIGAKMSWLSKTMGDGSLEIKECVPYKLIKSDLYFQPDQGMAMDNWEFEEQGDEVAVTWTTTMLDLDYPLGRYMGAMAGIMMKPFMQSGLNKLKAYAEALSAPPEIETIEVTTMPSLSVLDSTTVDQIGVMLERSYGKIMGFMNAKKIPMAGIPYAVYYNWNPDGMIKIRAAIPVQEQVKGKNEVEYFELPAGKVLFVKHFGGYDTSRSHEAIEEFMQDFNITCDDYIWEVYVTDPATEPDESKWETDIYYPIK